MSVGAGSLQGISPDLQSFAPLGFIGRAFLLFFVLYHYELGRWLFHQRPNYLSVKISDTYTSYTPIRNLQFLKLWIGAGMRPPRVTKASHEVWLTGIIGA